MKKCDCGFENDNSAKFCKKCGNKFPSIVEIQEPTSKTSGNNNGDSEKANSKKMVILVVVIAAVVCGIVAFMSLSAAKPDYYIAETGVTDNGWNWTKTVSKDGSYVRYEAYARDLFTADIGNSKFAGGLYYKDGTKSLAPLFEDTQQWPSDIYLTATANGNSGDGYVTVWRAFYSQEDEQIGIRYVSDSPSNLGTLTTTYHIAW